MKVLDLGCGFKKRKNSVGVDFSEKYSPDLVHDLNKFPYPFSDGSIDKIYMDNVLEHLESPLRVMEELFRILKFGGDVIITVPYFRSVWAFIDPTHRNFFTVNSFYYYDPDHLLSKRYQYTNIRFKVDKIIFNETLKNSNIKKLILKFANAYPTQYEYYFSHLYPLDDLTFYLKKSG